MKVRTDLMRYPVAPASGLLAGLATYALFAVSGSFQRLPDGAPPPVLGIRGVPVAGLLAGRPRGGGRAELPAVTAGLWAACAWLTGRDDQGRSRPLARILAASLATLFALALIPAGVLMPDLQILLLGLLLAGLGLGLWSGRLDPTDPAPPI